MLRISLSIPHFKRFGVSSIHQHNARFSRCAVAAAAQGAKPKGQSFKRPIESTQLDQNPHTKHAASGKGGDKGRNKAPSHGNAADDPKLPSPELDGSKKSSKSASNVKGKRGMHWSAAWLAEGDKSGSGHTADSYFKDVDTNEPTTTSTYSVGGDEATKAHRPNEQYADPKKQYATVSRDEPYEPPTSEAEHASGNGERRKNVKEANLRYGGTEKDSERGTSRPKESAAEGNAGGRKPEGRK